MHQNTAPRTPEEARKVVMIIAAALMMGLITTTGMMTVLSPPDLNASPSMLAHAGAGVALLLFFVSQIAPNIAAQQQLKGADLENDMAMFGAYQTRMITGFAMLEGAGMFNAVLIIVDGSIQPMIVVALILITMVTRFPTPGKIDYWIQTQRENQQFEPQN